MALYESDAFGPGYKGNIFTAHFNNEIITGKQIVTRNVIEPHGATWKSTLEENFIQSSDINCKFTDVIEDADGSLLIVNTGGWFRIGCPTSKVADGPITGGIYRVRKIGHKPPEDPRGLKIDWTKSTDEQLVRFMNDKRPVVRERAITTLAKRGTKSIPALEIGSQVTGQ